MRQVPEDPDGCNEFERVLLKDLELTAKYMQRVMGKSEDRRLKTPAFHAQANLLTAGILSQQRAFFDSVRKLHDRSGQAQSGVSAPPGGHEHTRDGAPSAAQPQHSAHDPQATGGRCPPIAASTRSALRPNCSSGCIGTAMAGRSACTRSWSKKKASRFPTRP